jgi:hypothetical protein
MPPNPDALRCELQQQGIDPDDLFGKWLLALLLHGEAATSTGPAPPGKPDRKRPRPPRKTERSQPT